MKPEGLTLWLTGLSGAGKTTISRILEREISGRGLRVERLDGDMIRSHLSKDLGFTKEDRFTQIERVTYVAKLLTRHGVIVIVSLISPYREMRNYPRQHIPPFVEIYVHCPLEECIRRDVKGLYNRALKGEIHRFTGIHDPYEPPDNPDFTVYTKEETPEQSAERILHFLETRLKI
ncbi:adenylylsulfate kinase [Melghirimyces profundicolus]|uniref:Adenylyl-sulfate kinase n=1 Tax=Melghirimyces profundicolus TaxID=1242148 RepID=A0A2T6B232_9BACL|nr:adenylyl-sulfate kinase [Melghirimyces profundicolus]PTX50130.1 adenylylsulfate kinase [Melghirimyces profundicolus]